MIKKSLKLFYGTNGSGKTTVARYLATKNKGLHIELDWYSSMHRGKDWHTRSNNKDKMHLLIGTLDAALENTKYKLFYIDGVLIYPFMFKMLEDWCLKNKLDFEFIKLVGDESELNFRVSERSKKPKENWNSKLPDIYKKLIYKNSREINTTKKSLQEIVDILT